MRAGSDAAWVGSTLGCADATCSEAYTSRKYNWAVWPTMRTSSSCCTFGTLTTICRSPEVVTSVSPTPIESTRC